MDAQDALRLNNDPSPKADVDTSLSERDILESCTLAAYSDLVQRFGAEHYTRYDGLQDGSFGFSFLGYMLYVNGRNAHSLNNLHPTGLVYDDGENFFSFTYFQKQFQPGNTFYLHIVSPKGKNDLKVAIDFIDDLRRHDWFPKTSCYIRHLTTRQYQNAVSLGACEISVNPWHPEAHSEDETFNHRLVRIGDIINSENDSIKVLGGTESKGYRQKAKMAYNRFLNFLSRNSILVEFIPYNPTFHLNLGKDMIKRHFETLEGVVGSTPEDYYNILEYFPSDENAGRCFGLLGYLKGISFSLPLILFIGEKISDNTMALYATFSLRDVDHLPKELDVTGFTAISQYAYIEVFKRLKDIGVDYVDLGGSEKEDLNTFKRQLGAKEVKTFWVVY